MLVPSELEGVLESPAAQMLQLPFYVMPYKWGAGGHERGFAIAQRQEAAAVTGFPHGSFLAWMSARIAELEEALPLQGDCTIELPGFISELLGVRAQAVCQTRGVG